MRVRPLLIVTCFLQGPDPSEEERQGLPVPGAFGQRPCTERLGVRCEEAGARWAVVMSPQGSTHISPRRLNPGHGPHLPGGPEAALAGSRDWAPPLLASRPLSCVTVEIRCPLLAQASHGSSQLPLFPRQAVGNGLILTARLTQGHLVPVPRRVPPTTCIPPGLQCHAALLCLSLIPLLCCV